MRHIIIGSGAAGVEAARELRAYGEDGSILMFSQDMGMYSRCMMHQFLSGEREKDRLRFVETDFCDKLRIEHHDNCPVQFVDTERKCVRAGGEEYFYDRLLIAAGSVFGIPPIPGLRTADNVFGFRDLKDAEAIARACEGKTRAFIIGSGLVGMDVAYALLQKGISVVVAEMADRIIPLQTDEYTASVYQKLFEDAGASFRLGKGVVNSVIDENNCITKIVMGDGEEVPCDFVVVAAGVRPNIGFLEGSGIQTERGISVNEYLETSAADVYAAGDVTGLSGIWPNAVIQGRVAARNMMGQKEVYQGNYGMKNTMNFFQIPMLSVGKMPDSEEDCRILVKKEGNTYCKIARKGRRIIAIIALGCIDHGGIWEYLIKNGIEGDWTDEEVFSLGMSYLYGFADDARERRKKRLRAFGRK